MCVDVRHETVGEVMSVVVRHEVVSYNLFKYYDNRLLVYALVVFVDWPMSSTLIL